MVRYRYIRYLFFPALACMTCMSSASAMPLEEQPESESALDPRVCEIGDLVWSDEFDEDGPPERFEVAL